MPASARPFPAAPAPARLLAALAALLAMLVIAGESRAKDLVFEEYFAGRTYAYGTFKAINGVQRSFKVTLTGRQRGAVFALREDFVYDDGERDTKTWRFRRTGPNTYRGTREDVIGETIVRLSGNEARFNYQVDLNPEGPPNIVHFFDYMRLEEDGTLINRATVTKFLLPVARVKVNFARSEAAARAIRP